jgi:hypothetical protein
LGAPPLNSKKVIIINILTFNLMALRQHLGLFIFNPNGVGAWGDEND